MFVTKKRLLEEVRKAKLEGIAEGKQDLERQVEMAKERGIKEGYNRGWTDRTNYYTLSVIPEKEKKVEKIITSYKKIINKYKERNFELRNKLSNHEVANKSLREIGERLMFRVGELKEEKEELEDKTDKLKRNISRIKKDSEVKEEYLDHLEECVEELKLNNDLYDFQEIKRLEQLMKKVKRVKVKKKIQSRIDKLMIRGL